MDSRKKKYLDKIVEHLVNRTKYDTDHLNLYTIKFPFSDTWEIFGSDREMSSIYDISPERFGIYRWNFDQEMINVFDLIEHESDYVWEKYFEGARFFGNEYANSDGLINESIEDKKKEYLDKVVTAIIRETEIDNDKREIYVPFFIQGDNSIPLSLDNRVLYKVMKTPFIKHCKNIYGLTNKEIEYVWINYIEDITSKYDENYKKKPWYNFLIGSAYGINESMEDKQKEFLDKVVSRLINETEIDYNKREMYIPFSVDNTIALSIDYILLPHIDKYPPFIRHCKNIYGLTNEECDYAWRQYKKNIKGKCAENHKKKPWHKFLTNESIEDKQKKYLIENYDKSEKFKNNIEKLLNQELKLLILEDWIDEDSTKLIKSVESIVVDEAMRNVGHFDVVVFITLNIGNNRSRYTPIYNNYGGIINYLGDKIQEIIPNLKIKFKFNYIDNQLSEQIEPNYDRQKEYLKKVVIRMIDETVPYRKFDASSVVTPASSVVTPFIAAKPNGRFVLSAHYCKEVIDNPDHYLVPKIITDYLDMYGLTGGEMYEVMYLYYNEIYNKYFKSFFDRRDARRSKLSESVDLGYTDKIVDMVLREIVWDFDRGLVYLPMINYSASIRDDDFLSAVNADDPFSNRFSGDTRWHIDLMKHIEDTYGITGNEWGRVWGSLQGEIWDKTDKYWDSFTRGY